jgi:Fe-S-cluster containining protein
MTLEETFLLECKEFDSEKNDETKKHLLSSGIPCTIHNCVKCCIETRMPLSRFDIERISRQGYRFKDFVVKRGKERYLRNSNGRCVFLGDDGCMIYSFRPEGCRLYPLVYDENYGKVVVHELCPYGHDFKVSRDDIENLHDLLKKLSK